MSLKKAKDGIRIEKCNTSLLPSHLNKKLTLSLCYQAFLHWKLASRTWAKGEGGTNTAGDVWHLCTPHSSKPCAKDVDDTSQLKEDKQGSRGICSWGTRTKPRASARLLHDLLIKSHLGCPTLRVPHPLKMRTTVLFIINLRYTFFNGKKKCHGIPVRAIPVRMRVQTWGIIEI